MSAAEAAGIQFVHHPGAVESLYFGDTVLLYHHVDCSARPATGKFLVQPTSCDLSSHSGALQSGPTGILWPVGDEPEARSLFESLETLHAPSQ